MTDRDRLIELIRNSNCVSTWDYHLDDFKDPNPVLKLADYLLANGVIVPPCKVGDTVYVVQGSKIYEQTVEDVMSKAFYFVDNSDSKQKYWVVTPYDDFGKTVFLTKEEAEAELKKRGKENAT